MSLKRYIEMMTPKERSKAYSLGQSNLNPEIDKLTQAKSKTKNIFSDELLMFWFAITKEELEKPGARQKFHNELINETNLNRGTFIKNTFATVSDKVIPRNTGLRLVLTPNGQFYMSTEHIHYEIILKMLLDGVIQISSDKEASIVHEKEGWDFDDEYLKACGCFIFVEGLKNTVCLAESYDDAEFPREDLRKFKVYSNILAKHSIELSSYYGYKDYIF